MHRLWFFKDINRVSFFSHGDHLKFDHRGGGAGARRVSREVRRSINMQRSEIVRCTRSGVIVEAIDWEKIGRK